MPLKTPQIDTAWNFTDMGFVRRFIHISFQNDIMLWLDYIHESASQVGIWGQKLFNIFKSNLKFARLFLYKNFFIFI